MKKIKKLNLTPYVLCILATLNITGCSSSGSDFSQAPGTTATGNNQKDIKFSNLNDLSYTPQTEDYRIGVGDSIKVDVFRVPEFSGLQRQVDPSGNMSLPLLGTTRVTGLTQRQLENKLATDLKKSYLQNPQVTVSLLDSQSQNVTLEGWFKSPGIKPINSGQVTLLQLVAQGGGLQDIADPGKVVLFRKTNGNVKAYRMDLNNIRDGKAKDPYLKSKDIVVAHRSDNRYWLKETAGMAGSILGIGKVFGM